ncbi:MAG TPA: SRPBCC family protein [bacterium]|nr:SRPBCC family protein [bacterium]
MIHTLRRQQVVRASLEEVWDFFSTPRNLDALTPDELSFRIVGEIAETMYEGQIIEYRVRFIKGIWSRWVTEITHVRDKSFFVDEQRLGPYKLWHHEHHFIPEGDGVRLVDRITYVIGFGFLGDLVDRLWVHRKLARIFDYRQEKTATLFGFAGTDHS